MSTFSSPEAWVILNSIEKTIEEKIIKNGIPLKKWDIQINYGIKTGFNDAFIITDEKRKELIKTDPKSEQIIRPILRGRDIKKYDYEFADLWLINTHNGSKESGAKPVNINDYPAIKSHLDLYYAELEKRADQGVTPYNLRNCAYMEDFYKQKIVWARLMRIAKSDDTSFPRFSIVPEGYFTVDSLCFIVGEHLEYLLHLLNSKVAAYYFFNNIAILDNGGMQMRQQYIENFPIPEISQSFLTEVLSDEKIYSAYNFDQSEIQFIEKFLRDKFDEIGSK